MGRIKSAAIKRIAKNLIVETPQAFGKDFEKNKRLLDRVITHKKTKNSIAGYITRLRKR